MSRDPGELALVLHTHVPWVAGHGVWPVGEEWLFQAWGTSWYPVTDLLVRLAEEGHTDVLTLGVTPVVAAQVADPRLRDDMGSWLGGQMWRAEEQRQSASRVGSQVAALAPFHWRHHARLLEIHERIEATGGLLATWRRLAEADVIEVLGGPSSHPLLALAGSPRLVDGQLAAGLAATQGWLGRRPTGLWPPELGYRPDGAVADPTQPPLAVDRNGTPTLARSGPVVAGLEDHYQRHGVDHVVADAPTLVLAAGGRDRDWTVRPLAAPAGVDHPDDVVHDGAWIGDSDVAAFARDLSVAYHVWSPTAGYPGHGAYRDFFARGNFGLHPSWRVTDREVDLWDKQVYDPTLVDPAVDHHVDHFHDVLAEVMAPRDGALVVAAYDTELFGHWWFEGPSWLERLLRRVHDDPAMTTTTLASRLRRRPPTRRLHLAESSWGYAKGHASWVTSATRPLWRTLRSAERRLLATLDTCTDHRDHDSDDTTSAVAPAMADAVTALGQLAASDWPFMVAGGATADYAHARMATHVTDLERALAAVDPAGSPGPPAPRPSLPPVEVAAFLDGVGTRSRESGSAPLRILLLSWEFPPRILGGLGRHVAALATAMVSAGHHVTVVTTGHLGAPDEEVVDGVHVVRVSEHAPGFDLQSQLAAWVMDCNLRLLGAAALLCRDHDFDVVHAHDWLVAAAAIGLRRAVGVPVVATIHATEHGRHQGHLPGDLNRWIHDVEGWLANSAQHVITCSEFMRDRVTALFDVAPGAVSVVPNGVDRTHFNVTADEVRAQREAVLGGGDDAPGVLLACAGRLEWEKGVHVAIDALGHLADSAAGPVTLAIAGHGSQADALRTRAHELGLSDRVRFLGFLDPADVPTLLGAADVVLAPSLYEPFGMVALEALAAGTPVVVGDTGGMAELAAAGIGHAVPPGDPIALADAVTTILADPDTATRMVTRGRHALTHHDWSTIATRTAHVLTKANHSP